VRKVRKCRRRTFLLSINSCRFFTLRLHTSIHEMSTLGCG
jgi:hypothetical protein